MMDATNSTEPAGLGDLVGVIRHRLLINRLADPAEVAPLLPEGIRPHVLSESGGVVVGCCLISIEDIRPWPAPSVAGLSISAAAHRISVDVGPVDDPSRAVYVPCRHTDGILPVVAGGRIYPGVHRRADITMDFNPDEVAWAVKGRDNKQISRGDGRFDISVSADRSTAVTATSEVAEVVIGTKLGVSPGHKSGSLESADMCLADQHAEKVELTDLQSDFLDSFDSAVPADTLLMTNVDVIWRRQRTPKGV